MIKKYFLALFLVCTLLHLPADGHGATRVSIDYDFVAERMQRVYNAQSHLSNLVVTEVAQTGNDYIWVGTYNGLFRFDGKNFLHITPEMDADFLANMIQTLFVAKDGTLYVGSFDNGLYAYKNGDFKQIFSHTLTHNTSAESASFGIRSITQDGMGTIFVATTRGLAKIVHGGLVFLNDPFLDGAVFKDMVFDTQNRLWALTDDYRFFILKDDKILNIGDFRKNEHIAFPTALTTRGAHVLVGTEIDRLAEVTYTDKFVITQVYELAGQVSNIKSFFHDDDKLWVLGNTGLGYMTQQGRFVSVEGLKVRHALERMIKDHEGNYWLASLRQGLLLLGKSKFRNELLAHAHNDALLNATVFWNDLLYIATNKELLAKEDNIFVDNILTDTAYGHAIKNFLVDSQNNLWLSTDNHEFNLVKVSPDFDMRTFSLKDGLLSTRIYSLLERRNGEIWVGTSHGINVISQDSIVKSYTTQEGLHKSIVLSMAEDAQGAVLVGSANGGIYKILDDTVTNFTEAHGLSSHMVLRMRHDPRTQKTFISTGKNTVEVFDGIRVHPVSSFRAKGNILDFLFYDDIMLILTSGGLYTTQTDLFLRNGTIQHFFDKNLAALGTGNAMQFMTDMGIVYLLSDENLFSFDVLHMPLARRPTLTNISAVDVDGKMYYTNFDEIILPPTNERLTIHFANLTYVDNARSTVTYKLQGFSQHATTVSLGAHSSVSYTNLPSGDYSFTLSGTNADGLATVSPAPLRIYKVAPWYENILIQILSAVACLLVGICIVNAFYRVRERRILERQQEYREITTQAITAIANTIDAKDNYTKGHSVRVAKYSRALGARFGYDELALDSLYYTALLHDIGKIGIPDAILKKSTALNDEEYAIMQSHAALGAEILKNMTVIDDITLGAKFHHEHYAGGGYPNNLSGEDIPFVARIICVADSFDAIASRRIYRGPTSINWVINEFKRCSGTQFDPEIVTVFLDMIEKGHIDLDELDGLKEN